MSGKVEGRIAPHENNEVRLVLGGYKPIATIEKAKQPIGYALAISLSGTGALHAVVYESKDSPEGEVVITAPHNKYKVQQYFWLLAEGVKELGIKEYHRRMGRLFGYTEEDINAFIEAEIHCECSKCKGR
jgi:hypothetical protein